MVENFILLGIGLAVFCVIAIIGEICAKKFDWE